MKQIFLTLAFFSLLVFQGNTQNLKVKFDTMSGEFNLSQNTSMDLSNYIINKGNSAITLRWTRNIVQVTPGWTTNFCDLNLCYLPSASSKVFELLPADTGLLKPVFLANGIEGCIIYRIDLTSETPNVTYQKSLLFYGRSSNGCQVTGAADIEEIKDFALFPNPANETLNVIFADVNFKGNLEILDLLGKVVLQQKATDSNTQMDVSKLPIGTYSLRAMDEKGSNKVVKKFTKI
jgi:Secretion system C-terminal sorting domain